jgi:hypothetical protein
LKSTAAQKLAVGQDTEVIPPPPESIVTGFDQVVPP